jgi:adenylyltransferase/sulfurtransferase
MRFDRQISLPEIGRLGQEKLKRARVVCVGVGGLGCPALQYLVAAGVGHVVLVDGDRVEESNLPRQILFGLEDVGQLKVDAALKRLQHLNPETNFKTYAERLTNLNVIDILEGATLVIDGTDNFSSKFLINDAAVKIDIPVIWAAATGFEGQASVFWASKGPCYRCYVSGMPRGSIQSCNEVGVLGPVPGIIGTMQALEAIKVIVGQQLHPAIGQLLTFSGIDFQFFHTEIRKNPACKCAHPDSITLEAQKEDQVCIAKKCEVRLEDIEKLGQLEWLDVRELNELDQGSIAHARNIPLSRIEKENLGSLGLDSDGRYLLVCRSGVRSLRAASILMEHGIKCAWSLSGGIKSL